MFIYIKTEPGLWTVGFYKPDGNFSAIRDFNNETQCVFLVSFLNGGSADISLVKELMDK